MRPTLRGLAALAALSTLAALPASALAVRPADYGFQVNAATTARTWEDASLIGFSITPATRARIRVHGHVLRVPVSANTLTAGGTTAQTLRYAGKLGVGAFVDRPLTAAERRRWSARPVWTDADVLVVNPGDPRCAQTTTVAAVRRLLTARATRPVYVPAGLTGDPEHLFGLHPTRGRSAYGQGVRAVAEASAVSAVASDPGAVAAVAWSAARAALAAGAVCAEPIGGVTATEATLRSGRYPATVPVSYVTRRGRYEGALPAYARRWYLGYLHSAKVRHLLRTARGRDRLLP
jgi:hypothetical protein